MTKSKSSEQPMELGGLLEEPKPTTGLTEDAGDKREGPTAEPKGTVQVQKEDKPQAQKIHQAQVPAGQKRVRFKDTGKMKVVGERAAAQLVRLKRAEYVN